MKNRQKVLKALDKIEEGFNELIGLYYDDEEELNYIDKFNKAYTFNNSIDDIIAQTRQFKRNLQKEDTMQELKEISEKLEKAEEKRSLIVNKKLNLYKEVTKHLKQNTIIKVNDNLNIVINDENIYTPKFYLCYIDNNYRINEIGQEIQEEIYNNIEKIEKEILKELKNRLNSIDEVLK